MTLPRRHLPLLLLCLASLPYPVTAAAQATSARSAKLTVTVVDPSGAIVQGATVTTVGLEAATKADPARPARTSDKGIVVIEALAPGRYSIQAESPGFELGFVRDVRLRAGDNKHAIVLPLKGFTDSVTVSSDGQAAASSRSGPAFGAAMTRDQLEALSDDPGELARQINDFAGPDAIIRVDSFEGAQLPPKSQIKSVHVTRDQFAAETSQPGSTFIDIITQAGVGQLRGGLGMNFQDGRWIARSPFASARGPQQNRGFNGNVSGTLVSNKLDFAVALNGNNSYSTPLINANLPSGRVSDVLNMRQPFNSVGGNALLNWAATRDHTVRLGYNQNGYTARNQGVGLYDLPERAYSEDWRNQNFRIMEAGPLGRRFFINTRFTVNWSKDDYHSATEAPTIVVQDEFTRGGAQIGGETTNVNYTIASDVDYVRGLHSWRGGIEIVGSTYRTNQATNYLGTYTFASRADFDAGRPILYTRDVGDPLISYELVTMSGYFQDDLRISKSLTLSPGLRYSRQTHVTDNLGFEPRFGMTWAPFKSGKTTLRASTGIFHGFLGGFIFDQTVRYDGAHQRQLIISNPSFPDAGNIGTNPPTNKYLIDEFRLNKNLRHSVGIDQVITPRLRVNVIYAYLHQMALPRGKNLNAPVNGVRPDPNFLNVIQSVTDAEIRRHDLNATFSYTLAAGGAAANRTFFNWRRLTMNGRFTRIGGRRNGLGPFSVPASGTLETEWGPAPATLPWGTQVSLNSTQIRNLNVSLNWNGRGPGVFTETTGRDDNHDGLLNDRRPGVGLNSLRTTSFSTLNLRVAYNLGVGHAATPAGGPAAAAAPRYRVNIFANVNNVTNRANYTGYSGVLTSSNYMKPTGVQNPRSMSMGMNVSF